MNKQTLANSYERFVEEGIILIAKNRDPKVPVKTKLSPDWMPERDEVGRVKPEGKLWEFTETMYAVLLIIDIVALLTTSVPSRGERGRIVETVPR